MAGLDRLKYLRASDQFPLNSFADPEFDAPIVRFVPPATFPSLVRACSIAERSTYKFGLKTIGTNIPIISEDEMRKAKQDYLLVLPWHFIDEFEKREQDFLNGGGSFIVPCPQFKIISK